MGGETGEVAEFVVGESVAPKIAMARFGFAGPDIRVRSVCVEGFDATTVVRRSSTACRRSLR
jgi:hypothetical protein